MRQRSAWFSTLYCIQFFYIFTYGYNLAVGGGNRNELNTSRKPNPKFCLHLAPLSLAKTVPIDWAYFWPHSFSPDTAFKYSKPKNTVKIFTRFLHFFHLTFPRLGLGKLFPARERLVRDIPAGDGNIANLFLQCIASGRQAKMREKCPCKYMEKRVPLILTCRCKRIINKQLYCIWNVYIHLHSLHIREMFTIHMKFTKIKKII